MASNYPATYLFTWNSDQKNGTWGNDIERHIEQLNRTGSYADTWRCGNGNVKVGDRAFLIKLGEGKRGIHASGYISSERFRDKHWSPENNSEVDYVMIDFDFLINPERDEILPIDFLKGLESGQVKQHWSSQSSGIEIRKEVVPALEEAWLNLLPEQGQRPIGSSNDKFMEGRYTELISKRYERNPHARNACLAYHGHKCSVCDFDFRGFYGEIGQNFIHVHHLTQISTTAKPYVVDPIKDLRPVCPNCHAMLHKRTIPFTIEELKSKIKEGVVQKLPN